MHLFTFSDIFSAPLIRALCLTLVHSLWIGILLSLLTGMIMLATKKSTAALRYNLLAASFLGFIIAVIAVFISQMSYTANIAATSDTVSETATATITNAATQFYFIPGKQNFLSLINDFVNNYANIIVMVWFLMIVFRSIRFAGGLKQVHQLKHTQLSDAGDHWNTVLANLSRRLHIKRGISFFQSGIATVPMVAGHFKPVILFPLGLLSSVPPEEIEAILIHELAHIKRKDFLVNMLQQVAEILFFFNPAVLWVSSLIKIEREHCCDDIAVANTGNKRNYINALVSFQEYQLNNLQYAPALADSKQHLLQRVKRMLYNNSGSLNNKEKTSLTICLVVLATMMIFFTNAGTGSKNNGGFFSTISDTTVSIADRHYDPSAFKEGNTTVLAEKIKGITQVLRILKRNGVLYEIYGDVKSFKINGNKIPQAEWTKYKSLITSLIKQTKGTKAVMIAQQPAKSAEDMEADNRVAEQNNRVAEQDNRISAQDSRIAEQENRFHAQQQKDNIQQCRVNEVIPIVQKAEADAQKQSETTKREIEWLQTEDGKQTISSKLSYSMNKAAAAADEAREVANNYKSSAIKYPPVNYNDYKPAYKAEPAGPYNAYKPAPAEKKSYTLTGVQSDGTFPDKDIDIKQLTQNFVNDLSAAQIISGTAGLSYKMSATSLIVNGVVQPESIHKKLKEKYIKSDDWKLMYNWKETR